MAYRGQWDERTGTTTWRPSGGSSPPSQNANVVGRSIIEDSIQMLLKDGNAADRRSLTTRREWHETLAWIMSDDRTIAFSFECICDVLGIEPGGLRRRVVARLRGADPSLLPVD